MLGKLFSRNSRGKNGFLASAKKASGRSLYFFSDFSLSILRRNNLNDLNFREKCFIRPNACFLLRQLRRLNVFDKVRHFLKPATTDEISGTTERIRSKGWCKKK